jgi:hypothetical protein
MADNITDPINVVVQTMNPIDVNVGAGDVIEVHATEPEQIVVVVSNEGLQGPPGPAGDAAESKTMQAGENISSGIALIVSNSKAYKFNPNDPAHLGRVVGVSKTSALAGETVTIQTGGEATDAGYFFDSEKPCFVGPDGQITTTVPHTNIIQPLGVSINEKSFFIHILTPIKTVNYA